MAQFINPFTDEGFKRLFGQDEHKKLLIAFLNRLFEGEMTIMDVSYLDKESLPGHGNGKSYIYDIYCTLDTGEHVIVEMQNKEQDYFLQRSMVYAARCLDRQTRKGKEWNYEKLKAVFTISFLNFTHDGLPETLVVDGEMRDKYTGDTVNPYLRLIYIQLPQMTKPIEECNTPIEKWVYVLKNITSMVEIPSHLKDQLEELQYFEDVMNEESMTPEERARYEISLEAWREEMNVMSFYTRKGREEGREEGLIEGIAKGREEGRRQEAISIAKAMKAQGMSESTISQITNLSIEIIIDL